MNGSVSPAVSPPSARPATTVDSLRELGADVARQGRSAAGDLKDSLDAVFYGAFGHARGQDAAVPAGTQDLVRELSGRGLTRPFDAAAAAQDAPPAPPAAQPERRGVAAVARSLFRIGREMLFGEAEFAALRRPYLKQMNLSRLIMVLQAVVSTGVAYSTGAFVDAALAHAAPVALPWFGAMVGLIVARIVIGKFLWVLGERIKVGMRQDFRMALFSHLQRLPASYAGRAEAPEVTMRLLYDVGKITAKNADIPTQTPQIVVQLFMATYFVLHTSWPLGVAILASLPLLAFLSYRFGRKSEAQQRQISGMQADLTRLGQDLFAGNRDGQASGGGALAASVYKARSDEYESMWLKVAKLCSGYAALRDFLQTAFGEILILGAGLLSFILFGSPSVGQIMALRGYANDLRGAFSGILDRYNDSRSADGGLSRLHELRKALAAAADKPGAEDVSGSDLSFAGLAYSLPGQGQVLRGVDFSVRAGERVLVVGGESAARRSLADLLLRLDSPKLGSVRVGGKDVADLKRSSLVSGISLVAGNAAAFPGTLRDNLLLGLARPATDGELLSALKAAGARSLLDVARLPKGLDTPVQDKDGVVLDAEQRQRLALARAALKGSAVLVGEDVGQGLDPGDARGIWRSFARISKGKTTLFFAGQPDRGEDYDRIVVLKDGKVAEAGTHAELMARGGLYKDMVLGGQAQKIQNLP